MDEEDLDLIELVTYDNLNSHIQNLRHHSQNTDIFDLFILKYTKEIFATITNECLHKKYARQPVLFLDCARTPPNKD
jgi:hypothetical protein